MAHEIERKFLIKAEFKAFVQRKISIKQGYISVNPERTVRIRIADDKAFITIKGKSNSSGLTRYEWEKEIKLNEAEELLKLCSNTIIEKTRYIIPANNNLFFEVDEFYGDNYGLVIAEIELPTEETEFNKPNWLGEEVTGDKKYYNSMLVKEPFASW